MGMCFLLVCSPKRGEPVLVSVGMAIAPQANAHRPSSEQKAEGGSSRARCRLSGFRCSGAPRCLWCCFLRWHPGGPAKPEGDLAGLGGCGSCPTGTPRVPGSGAKRFWAPWGQLLHTGQVWFPNHPHSLGSQGGRRGGGGSLLPPGSHSPPPSLGPLPHPPSALGFALLSRVPGRRETWL